MPHRLTPINKALYNKIGDGYDRIKHRMGLALKVENPERLADGQIFLFNHFARFEVAMPLYIVRKYAGAYCRSIADKGLFSFNEKFANFLRECGTVPNNQEGLLPSLAAEILRGQKVIIFPEGGMVKSRKVLDDEGEYNIWSGKAQVFRKHHKGAAVLALTLDLFKQRIQGLFEDNDKKRLEHWRDALGMDSLDTLKEAANKPTLIVPATITFYPVRITDTVLSRAIKLFKKDLPPSLMEELIIESNLLFKKTDMTVRVGEGIESHRTLNWAEKALLKRHFLSIKKLDDLFGIQRNASNWPEKFLARFMNRETEKIRDAYMEGLYEGVTLNFSHVASTVILKLARNGVKNIPTADFCALVYFTIKALQTDDSAYLHDSLKWPERYAGLLEDTPPPNLARFLATGIGAGVIKQTRHKLKFLPKLLKHQGRHAIRLHNPIQLYANEAETVEALPTCIDDAIALMGFKGKRKGNLPLPPEALADALWDDTLLDFSYHHALFSNFSGGKWHDIPKPETVGAPYLLWPEVPKEEPQNTPALTGGVVDDSLIIHTEKTPKPAKKRIPVGVILVHGFVSSPVELRAYGEHLQRLGYGVMGVRLAGHGTSMHDLKTRTRHEWVSNVEDAYRILAPKVERVVIIGYSTGGVVAALMAQKVSAWPKLAGVVFASVPVAVQDKNMHILPVIQAVNTLVAKLPFMKTPFPFYNYKPSKPDIQYPFMPVNAINELRLSIKDMKKALRNITLPALILQGTEDETVVPTSAKEIYETLASTEKNLHFIESDQHNLIGRNAGKTWALIEAFLDGFK